MAGKNNITKNIDKILRIRKQTSTFAFVLAIAAAVLLLAFGLLTVFYADSVFAALKEAEPETTMTLGVIVTYGRLWLAVTLLMVLANYKIRKKADRFWMWFLFVVGMLAVFLGRPIIGLLTTAAAIIYLVRDDKLRKKL